MEQFSTMIFPLAILIVCVLIIIIPQRRRKKKINAMLAGLKIGDSIQTIGGVCGKVVTIEGDKVVIKTGNNDSEMILLMSSISVVAGK